MPTKAKLHTGDMMKTIDEIAMEVAMPLMQEGAMTAHAATAFAHRFLAAMKEEMEPVAWMVINGDRIVQLSSSQDPWYPHSTPLYSLEAWK